MQTFIDRQELWTRGGALERDIIEQSDTRYRFNVTRCKYAEMYRDMGLGEIGHLLSCQRDGTFCEGYDKRLKLKRTQTIMQGASHCDFDYTIEKDAKRVTTQIFAAGGYRFIPAVFQYSGGVAAEPGFGIERVTFRKPVPLAQGFERVAHDHQGRGRPLTAFCACELRSPAPFTDDGFRAFNEVYVDDAGQLGHLRRRQQDQSGRAQQRLPGARTSRPSPRSTPSAFTVAASANGADLRGRRQRRGARRRRQLSRAHRPPRRDQRPTAMREKARLRAGRDGAAACGCSGFGWARHHRRPRSIPCTICYPFLADEIVRRGAARHGLTWHFCRPPVRGLEYEMDCRGVRPSSCRD